MAQHSEASVPPWPAPWDGGTNDWCAAGTLVLAEDACVALPEAPSQELLVYLHGIVPPSGSSPQKTNFQNVVVQASLRAGVVALIPRGPVGLAPRKFPRWRGWPTTEPSYRRYNADLVARLQALRGKLEQRLGRRFRRLYLAGSSSGAYYVALLALHGGLSADGFGLMSGGSGHAPKNLSELSATPLYVGFGTHDSVGPGARALAKQLEAAGWPIRVAEHPLPHGAREIYLDEAFAFWRSARDTDASVP